MSAAGRGGGWSAAPVDSDPVIVLIGFMGAGKTTIGRLLAERLGLPFVDSDLVIEHEQRRTIAELFVERGESGFRQIEQRVIADLLEGPACVLSLGGGACGSTRTRDLLRGHTVVYLHVDLDEALARAHGDRYRPLLGRPDLPELYGSRLEVYASVATLTSLTTGRRAEDIALEIVSQLTGTTELDGGRGVLVAPPGGSYRVHVGHGLIRQVGRLLPSLTEAQRIVVISGADDQTVREQLAAAVAVREWEVHQLTVPPGSSERPVKSLAMLGELASGLAELAVHRGDLLLGVGGEEICDVVGFLAATYNRGMPLALVPTTLEAQADSAVGGKCSLDLPEGTNLLGLLHQPALVVSDVELAAAGGDADYSAGLAEIAKHALLADRELLQFLTERGDDLIARERVAVTRAVRRSVEIKADIVTSDEREQGARAQLNYGHTFSRAFAAADPGQPGALSLGLMAAAHLAHRLGWLDASEVDAHRTLLRALGLPTNADFTIDQLEWALERDKKYRKGWRFIVLRGLGHPVTNAQPTRAQVAGALADLAAG